MSVNGVNGDCRAMTDIKDLSSTAIYAWTTLVSVLICVPGALIFEGPKLQAGIDAALKKEPNFYLSLLSVGLLYHLYNQVSTLPAPCLPLRFVGFTTDISVSIDPTPGIAGSLGCMHVFLTIQWTALGLSALGLAAVIVHGMPC